MVVYDNFIRIEMKTKITIILLLALGSIVILVKISSPRTYVPGDHPRYDLGPLDYFSSSSVQYGTSYESIEKSQLVILARETATYFSDGVAVNYPKEPIDLLTDNTLSDQEIRSFFIANHLNGTDKELAKTWQLPDTWEEFNRSEAPYLFLRSSADSYSGSGDTPLFIVKDGYQSYPDLYAVAFEDGHVSTVDRTAAILIWKTAIK
jgi:hypothetical protein